MFHFHLVPKRRSARPHEHLDGIVLVRGSVVLSRAVVLYIALERQKLSPEI